MELNQFIFPAPTPSYTSSGFLGELIYVPKYERDPETQEVIQFEYEKTSEKGTDLGDL